ncbi:unnamed protein product [Triticum turgidum subsp. durum]|uniref:Uncharacterized protein n=1 Tax=Triticum turgidum subsp. durum TaxID=4567 RepID=A0A9R0XN14_TRITD|nr:unnamed protein product [Triticum turgidum subsp. durum]
MHYVDRRSTACEDVLPKQVAGCSDLNITAFLYRVIHAEDPDLVIFTGPAPTHPLPLPCSVILLILRLTSDSLVPPLLPISS